VRWQVIIPLLSELNFAAGEAIVREGDDGDSLFIICSGSVEVLKAERCRRWHFEKRLAVLKVGDVFGEMELIDMQRRSARCARLNRFRPWHFPTATCSPSTNPTCRPLP
jgi:CRP-like cAMP-binding protein